MQFIDISGLNLASKWERGYTSTRPEVCDKNDSESIPGLTSERHSAMIKYDSK